MNLPDIGNPPAACCDDTCACNDPPAQDLTAAIQGKYGAVARKVAAGGDPAQPESCCGPSCCGGGDPITSNLYTDGETVGIPDAAVLASLGCGNPTALAELRPGEVVLDLGSGGGIDVLLSARRVGPTGKAYGLDLTDDMVALARENQRKSGLTNVEFLKGRIEAIPLPDDSVDVIISNCVINLSGDKRQVLKEAFRVLKPRGRFAVSDVVVRGDVPPPIRQSMELWIGCIAGALEEREYRALLEEAGFVNVGIEPTRVYQAEDARSFLESAGLEVPGLIEAADGRFMSAFVRAQKPLCAAIRPATPTDWEAVTGLLRGVALPIEGLTPVLEHFQVAEANGEVVGVAGMEYYGGSGLLRSVAVAPGWRGTGIGRALVERLLDQARAKGVSDVYLLTTSAENYFPRLGFGCISRAAVPDPVRASVEFGGPARRPPS